MKLNTMLEGRKNNASAVILLISLCCNTGQQHLSELCLELLKKKEKGKRIEE